MRVMLSFFQSVHDSVWGGSLFEWLFYASILLILIYEKRNEVKIVFACFCLAFHICIYNPLTYKALGFFFAGDYSAYCSRLYEMIPIIYCIAQGMMLCIIKEKNERSKLILIIIAAVLIIKIGADTNSYKMPWMQPATNLEKVPEDLIEICQAVHSGEDSICIATPSALSGYVRQLDASLYTPYSRYVDDLGEALDNDESPNVRSIMERAGQSDCDYIVAIRTENVKRAYRKAGYYPILQTNNYLLYEVTGVPRTDRVFNADRQIVAVSNYDEKGDLVSIENGYCTVCYEYDNDGNQYKEYYLDKKGEKVTLPQGYAMIERSYYPISGIVKTITYKDINGKQVTTAEGYSKVYKEYKHRKLIKETFYDQEGNVVNSTQ